MAEHFGFFDAVQDANGIYDREYNAEQFTIPFDALITNGVVRSAYEQLEVVTSGSNMVSRIKSGIAFIEGHHYLNDGIVELTHDVEALGMNRIDRVVIRKDSNPESRYVKAFIRKGLPSTNPVPPTLTRNEFVYEISLAQVHVVGGQGFISNIADERGTVNIGPWAGSDILPSYDENALAKHINNQQIHVNPTEKNNWNNALQPGAYSGANTTTNIGGSVIEVSKTFDISPQQLPTNAGGHMHIFIPTTMAFGGVIELEIISSYSNTNATGGIKVLVSVGFSGSGFYAREMKVVHVTPGFADSYYLENDITFDGGNLYFTLKKRLAAATNPLGVNMKLHLLGGDAKTIFNAFKNIGLNTVTTPQLETRINTDLFQSVSNGKSLVANAITQMGAPTAVNAEFATIANNIKQLRGFATGTRTVSLNGSLSVTGLTFEPKVVVATIGSGDMASHMYIEKHTTARGYIVSAFDGANEPGQPPTQFSPAWGKRKAEAVFTATSFNIPAKDAGTYTWYAYG